MLLEAVVRHAGGLVDEDHRASVPALHGAVPLEVPVTGHSDELQVPETACSTYEQINKITPAKEHNVALSPDEPILERCPLKPRDRVKEGRYHKNSIDRLVEPLFVVN